MSIPINQLTPTILVVDDEPEMLRAVRAGLVAQQYRVEVAMTGEEALIKATTSSPALIVLDLMLPGDLDGVEVCRRLREWTNIPIIVLSAQHSERQKVVALDTGADDYLTKPFGMNELTARIRAALRRYSANKPVEEEPTFTLGNLTVDYRARIVTKAGSELKLTPIEYEILRYMTRNADRVLTHRQILSAVWGPEYSEETQLLRVHLGHLRRKIEDDPNRPRMIVTEPAVGYRFRTE